MKSYGQNELQAASNSVQQTNNEYQIVKTQFETQELELLKLTEVK